MSSDKTDKSQLDTPEAQCQETAAVEAMKKRDSDGPAEEYDSAANIEAMEERADAAVPEVYDSAANIEAMKKRADGGHQGTPEELEAELEATKKLRQAFEPKPIETPVYKPPPSL